MYEVIEPFKDKQDDMYEYKVGKTYPREGFEPANARIAALLTGKKGKLNEKGKVYLAEISDPPGEPPENPEP